MIYSLFIIALIAFLCPSVSAFSSGSGTCRATQISDVPMPGVSSAPSSGFTFSTTSTSYTPGQKLTFTINHPTAGSQFIGLLAFVEKSDQTAVGIFDAKTGTTFTGNFPPSCNNKKTTITHSSQAIKTVPYTLDWTAPAAGTGPVTARVAVMVSGRGIQFINIPLTEAAVTTTTVDPGSSTTSTTSTTTTTSTASSTSTTSTTTATTTSTTTTTAPSTTTTVAPSGNSTTTSTSTTTIAATTSTLPAKSSAVNSAASLSIIIAAIIVGLFFNFH